VESQLLGASQDLNPALHTYIHTYIQLYIHKYINKYINTYIKSRVLVGKRLFLWVKGQWVKGGKFKREKLIESAGAVIKYMLVKTSLLKPK